MNGKLFILVLLIFLVSIETPAPADDWPLWGRDSSRNMVSAETGIPNNFNLGESAGDAEEADLSTAVNVKWIARLGAQAYGNVTVSNGKVFVGTNNESPRDPKHLGDRGVLMCFDEKTGNFLWQLIVPKLLDEKPCDLDYLGICSSPSVDSDCVYVVTNRCEVVCLDIHGLTDGNDGPFQEEGAYMVNEGRPAMKPGTTDADILWRFDMRHELEVFPHNITSSSVLVVDGRLYITTSNGQDWQHEAVPSLAAPCLIVLDKNTGALLGVENSGISQRLMHCNWSSPAYGKIHDTGMIFFGAGDGYCYGFDPIPVNGEKDQKILKERWRFDCVPPDYRKSEYTSPEGPSEIISTPVFYKNRVYAAIGQDPENGNGLGMLSCIDPSKSGDITKSGSVWTYQDITRSISTPSIVDGLLFMADYAGFIHCLDADTGNVYWVHDTQSCIWGSTLAVDGKIYVGNEDGYLLVLKADKKNEILAEIDMGAPVYSTPIVANGVLYISTQTHLYAIQSRSK